MLDRPPSENFPEGSRANGAGLAKSPSGGWSERRALAVVLAGVGVYLIVASLARGCGGRGIELERATERAGDLRLDLNRAGWAELLQLPGVGPKLADRIVAYREANDGFARIEDLERVEGVGPRLLERVAAYVYVEGNEGQGEAESAVDAR